MNICDTASVIKPVHQLMIDEIRASLGAERSNALLPLNSAKDLLNTYSRGLLDEGALASVRADLGKRNQSWKSASDSFLDELRTADPTFTRKNVATSFEDHFAGLALAFAKDWGRRAGVLEGFDEWALLENRVVHAGIGYCLALDWDHKYGTRADRPVDPSDGRDLQHAILAAASCDVVVSCDRLFRSRLERVRVERLDILDCDEFVARVL